MRYLETSAKQADNVEKLFVQIASELMEVKMINLLISVIFEVILFIRLGI